MDNVHDKTGRSLQNNVTGIITNLMTEEAYTFSETWDYWVNRKTVNGQMQLNAMAQAPGSESPIGLEATFAGADPKAGVYEVGTPEFALRVAMPYHPFYWLQAVPGQTLFLRNFTPDSRVAGSWSFNAETPDGVRYRADVEFEILGIQP